MSEYSMFLNDEMKLGTAYDNPSSGILDLEEIPDYLDKDSKKAMLQGFQAGGIGSGLMSAGVMSGSAPLALGGLGFSMVEASQRSKQAAEAERVRAEEEQKKNQLAAINTAISASRGLS